jgi:hypothetical protein
MIEPRGDPEFNLEIQTPSAAISEIAKRAEPDPDRGEVDGSAECVVAFVVAGGHRPVGFELVDGAFDDVALLVDLAVDAASIRIWLRDPVP